MARVHHIVDLNVTREPKRVAHLCLKVMISFLRSQIFHKQKADFLWRNPTRQLNEVNRELPFGLKTFSICSLDFVLEQISRFWRNREIEE